MSSRMVSYWNRLDNKYFNLQKTLNYTLAVFRRRGQEHSNINQSKYLIPLVEPGPLSVHSIIFTLVKTKAITFIDTIHIYESIHIFTYDSGVFYKIILFNRRVFVSEARKEKVKIWTLWMENQTINFCVQLCTQTVQK